MRQRYVIACVFYHTTLTSCTLICHKKEEYSIQAEGHIRSMVLVS